VEAAADLALGAAGLLAVAVLVVVLAFRRVLARRRALAAWAARRGWRYEVAQPLLVDRFTGPPFGLGEARRATNAVFGHHDGRDLVAFDYEYVAQGGDGRRQRHSFSVLALQMGVPMPPLRVDPEGWLDRFVGRLTGDDVDLESDDFNRAFQVRCPDRRFASDVLHPRMMELLLEHPQLGWRFEQDSMLVVAAGRRTPAQLDATLAVMDAITDLVPEFVWLRLRGPG
jgi:hypothetical protein